MMETWKCAYSRNDLFLKADLTNIIISFCLPRDKPRPCGWRMATVTNNAWEGRGLDHTEHASQLIMLQERTR